MKIRERLVLGLTQSLAPYLIRGIYSSLRFEIMGDHNQSTWQAGRPVVFITWHGRILPLLYLYRDRDVVMLVSQHRDGEYLARVGNRLGYDAVRGSSTRGGYEALRELARKVEDGKSLAITPDGPQGPREKLKPGALQVARLTGAPVIPVAAGCRQAWWVEGWDRFLIPKPFARVKVAIGAPLYIPREASVRDLAELAGQLEVRLRGLVAEVDGDSEEQ